MLFVETGQTVGCFSGNDLRLAAAPFFGLSGSPLAINFLTESGTWTSDTKGGQLSVNGIFTF